MLIILTLVATCLAKDPLTLEQLLSRPQDAIKLSGRALVDYVNANQNFFEAEYTPHKRPIMDIKYLYESEDSQPAAELEFNGEIPERFDAREQWPKCPSLTYVPDQSNCGSCWAVSTAAAVSDRACVQSKGKIKTMVSASDLLSCCPACGSCDGGNRMSAWEYVKEHGLCSGGPYEAKGVCKPYPFHPCGHHEGVKYYGECPYSYPTPSCERKCKAGYSKSYEKDRIHGKSAYRVQQSETAIQKEIMINGPVTAGFAVYTDFFNYKKGIYVHTGGYREGAHAIKIIGWGVEKGVKYWTIANSWNTDFGEDGYFRILRGQNHCNIEGAVVAGLVNV